MAQWLGRDTEDFIRLGHEPKRIMNLNRETHCWKLERGSKNWLVDWSTELRRKSSQLEREIFLFTFHLSNINSANGTVLMSCIPQKVSASLLPGFFLETPDSSFSSKGRVTNIKAPLATGNVARSNEASSLMVFTQERSAFSLPYNNFIIVNLYVVMSRSTGK